MIHRSRSNRTHRAAGSYGLVWIIALAAGCATPLPGPPADREFTDVAIQDIGFEPKEITVRRGATVRWTNREEFEAPHTVTSGAPGDEDAGNQFDCEPLNPGEFFDETFNQVGEFSYFCRIHSDDPEMRDARVTVIEE